MYVRINEDVQLLMSHVHPGHNTRLEYFNQKVPKPKELNDVRHLQHLGS
jgi:hypothetical protein